MSSTAAASGPCELQNFAEDVRQSMWAIEALQHAQRAADLHFVDEDRPLGLARPFVRETGGEVVGKLRERHVHALHGLFFTSSR
jgi:hypothetical protein